MPNIKVNTSELKEVLTHLPSTHNLMLVGNHGIGKSEIITEFFKGKGLPVVALFLGQMSDPGDLIGLPRLNGTTGRTEFIPPYWFPEDGQPIALFLDELNRARPEILQVIMDLCLNRTIAGRRLPEGSYIVSAVNEGERYQLTDLDPALVSRFNVVTFAPETAEWLLWADRNGLDKRVTAFIQDNPIFLDSLPDSTDQQDTGLEKTPDRRGWKRVSDIVKGQKDLTGAMKLIIASIVGPTATAKFLESVSSARLVTAQQVLDGFASHEQTLSAYPLHSLVAVSESLFRFLEVSKGSVTAQRAKNLEEYFSFLTRHSKEASAHFANLYVKRQYPNATTLIARDCRTLAMCISLYIKSI